jgi:hypothetical protein
MLPALAYFTDLAPPLLPSSVLLTQSMAVGTLAASYYIEPRSAANRPRNGVPPLVRRGITALASGVVLLGMYAVLLAAWTVSDGTHRYQIGFGTMGWSLTEEGLKVKAAHPSSGPWIWMMNDALFTETGPQKLWKPWTIYLSFAVMFAVFTGAFTSWTHGWAMLAKQRSRDLRAAAGAVPDLPAMPDTRIAPAE